MYPSLTSRADILKMLDEMTGARKQILERCERLTQAQLQDPVYPGTWSVLHNLAHLACVRLLPGPPEIVDLAAWAASC